MTDAMQKSSAMQCCDPIIDGAISELRAEIEQLRAKMQKESQVYHDTQWRQLLRAKDAEIERMTDLADHYKQCWQECGQTTGRLEAALKEVVKAWEALPGPHHYHASEVQSWLSGPMCQSINNARHALEGK